MEDKTTKLEKEIEVLKGELRFKRLCLSIAIDNREYTLQTVLQDEINELRAKINELELTLSELTKGTKVVSLEELKKKINECYKARH